MPIMHLRMGEEITGMGTLEAFFILIITSV